MSDALCLTRHKARVPGDRGCSMREILVVRGLENDALVVAFALPSRFLAIVADGLPLIALDPSLAAGEAT